MKKTLILIALVVMIHVNAGTIVVRQPGLVEAVGQTAVGLVACTGEMVKGLVCGSTTVVQTPDYAPVAAAPAPVAAAPVAAAPVAPAVAAAPAVVAPAPVMVAPAPVVVAPAVPLAPYGAYYAPGYRHYYGPGWGGGYYRRPYCRPCRPYGRW